MTARRPEPDLTAVVIAREALRAIIEICRDVAARPYDLAPDATWRRLLQLVNTTDLDGRPVFGEATVGPAYDGEGRYLGRAGDPVGTADSPIPAGPAVFGSPPGDLFTAVSGVLRRRPGAPDDLVSLSAHVDQLGAVLADFERRVETEVGGPQADLDRVLRSASIAGARAALSQPVPTSLLSFLADG